jgi:hypothetical protein
MAVVTAMRRYRFPFLFPFLNRNFLKLNSIPFSFARNIGGTIGLAITGTIV